MLNNIEILDNSILIVPPNIKNKVIETISKSNRFINVKYVSFEQLEDIIYSYDKSAIWYLMNKYNYKYNVAKVYLDNIRYIDSNKCNTKKLDNLNNLKEELISNNLISYNKINFNNYDYVYVYGYTTISNYQQMILDSLNKEIVIISDNNLNIDNVIVEFSNINDEVVYVADSICKLVKEGISCNNIKIVVEDKKYHNIINYIFNLFGLSSSISNDSTTLELTTIGRYFIDNLDKDIKDIMVEISNKFNLNDEVNLYIYNKIIDIINSYDDIDVLRNLIYYDFKGIIVNNNIKANMIEVISLSNSYISDEDYVFILGFNHGIIPYINVDELFFCDLELIDLGLDTSKDRNMKLRSGLINKIRSIKNLVITYKLQDNDSKYLISNLNEELQYRVIDNYNTNYCYSNRYNKLKLAALIDDLVKYSVYNKDLEVLYNNYIDIDYLKYDNKYKGVDSKDIARLLDNKLSLSYSSISKYFECSFKYYLSNILKIDDSPSTYISIIGDVYHYILSKVLEEDINVEEVYNNYISKLELEITYKERFYLNTLKRELPKIIEIIKEQYKHTSFNKAFYEERIVINKEFEDFLITFKGFVDKIMYKVEEDRTLIAIIDYKTGNPKIDINNIKYGLDMQLGIYAYLITHFDKLENPYIVGFYLQKLLNKDVNKDYDKSSLVKEKKALKLEGYSTNQQDILEKFDDSYADSEVIKSMGLLKSLDFKSYSKVLSEKDINDLIELIDKKVDEAIENIIKGNFSINPKIVGKENKACTYCKFYDVCYKTNSDYVKIDGKEENDASMDEGAAGCD